MSKKKIFLIVILVAIMALVVIRLINHLRYQSEVKYVDTHYILDKKFRASSLPANFSGNPFYHQGRVTAQTSAFFAAMGERYPIKDLNEHFEAVRKDLSSRFAAPEAQPLFEIYQKYLKCENQVASSLKFKASGPDPRHLLILMSRIQNFRREELGPETADILFGADIKEREYTARRALIITDQTLYGRQKEERLQKLKTDMWGDEKITIDEHPEAYNRYTLKLSLYEKDLAAMNEAQRKQKDAEFRKEFFTPEELKRLEQTDRETEKDNLNLKQYRATEKDILNSKTLTQEDKDQKIRALQDKHFGNEAEAFRRGEVMRNEAEK